MSHPVATMAAIATHTPWSLRVTPLSRTPRVFSALCSVAVETRDHGDEVEAQAFPRASLVARLVAYLSEAPADDPERVRRPGRIPTLLIDALTDQDAAFSDEALRDVIAAAPAALIDALPACEDVALLERSVPGHDFPRARVLVLSCRDHGRWALWDALDAREPWNIGKARVQRIDGERLTELVTRVASDLTLPEPDRRRDRP